MSDISAPTRRRKPRADAARSKEAVLQAAIMVLGQHPDAGLEQIAATAGVSRQTVYAHFPSRDALMQAAVIQITAEVVAKIHTARLDEGPARGALLRFLDICWGVFERYPVLLHAPPADPASDHALHEPVFDSLAQLIRRGQEAGEFDPEPSADWLCVATMAIGHAAGAEVAAGRMSAEGALDAVRRSALKLVSSTAE